MFNGIIGQEGFQMGERTHNIRKLLAGERRKVVCQGGPELFVRLLCALCAFGCNLKIDSSPILRIVSSLDETFIYQAVYYAGHSGRGNIEVVG